MVLKRVGVMSLAKIAVVLYALLGLLAGGVISLVSLLGVFAAPTDAPGIFGLLFGATAVAALPILYGCFAFIGALIVGGLYNLLAGLVGGVKLDLE